MPATSVIIGTYNDIEPLRLCLKSFEMQSFKDFEVIIAVYSEPADEIHRWLESYRPEFDLSMVSVNKPSLQKCEVLNQAVRKASADYLLFVESNCILDEKFTLEHWQRRQRGYYLCGKRVLVKQELAGTIRPDMLTKGLFNGISLFGIYHALLGHLRYYEEAIKSLCFFNKGTSVNFIISNFSVYKGDILSIGGFDENLDRLRAGIDNDIAYRLKAAGIQMQSVRYSAIQFYLEGAWLFDNNQLPLLRKNGKTDRELLNAGSGNLSTCKKHEALPRKKAVGFHGSDKKLKVALLRNTTHYHFAYYYFKALKKMNIDLIDIPFNPHERQPQRSFQKSDLLLLVDCGLPVEFPGLEEYNGLKGYVSIDSCHKLNIHKKYCEKYNFDVVWVAQKHVVEEFGPDALWLPLAADEDVHVYNPGMTERDKAWERFLSKSNYDIGMCGAPYEQRRRFEMLFKKAGLSTHFYFRKKFGEEAVRETAKCTIGFNAGAGFTGEKGMDLNMRVFETMANGKAMLLTNTYDGLGYEDLFKEGRHYAGFRTEEEAVEKAVYYAGHPEEAAKIAEEGQRHILAHHTYTHRCEKILTDIS